MKVFYNKNFADCYSIFIDDFPNRNGKYECIASSKYPTHPLGIYQHCDVDAEFYKNKDGTEVEIDFDSLPEEVKQCVLSEMVD